MKFRPCIDIHNGHVKQIVGGSLKDTGNIAAENFISGHPAEYYADMYGKLGLCGGHIIILNKKGSEYYDSDLSQALSALRQNPGAMQAGGGIDDTNARLFLENGASHVIVTSFVFKDGAVSFENLKKLLAVTGKDHLVLDLSCRKRNGKYYIVTDRWQKFTDVIISEKNLSMLSGFCDEFLIHAADVEGKKAGIDSELIRLLAGISPIQTTYAGGVAAYSDVSLIKEAGQGRVDFTVGSALKIFGGGLEIPEILKLCQR